MLKVRNKELDLTALVHGLRNPGGYPDESTQQWCILGPSELLSRMISKRKPSEIHHHRLSGTRVSSADFKYNKIYRVFINCTRFIL